MLKRIGLIVIASFAASAMWSCGAEHATQAERIDRPLSKLAARTGPAVVVVTVHQAGDPVSGATIAFSRAIAGRRADYQWSSATDEHGQARVLIGSSHATGYYQARVLQDESEIGAWSSIPINSGYEVVLDLPVDGRARVTGSALLAANAIVEVDDAVQIRSLLSLTGASSLGPSLRNGIELAVRDFGDVHGHAVDLGESMDSQCSPDGGSAGAEQIIADSQVLGIIGTSCSAAAVAASPLISEAGLVMIAPSNTSPLLTSDLAGNANPNYHPGYFRVSNNDLYQAQAVADFAYGELGLRRMAALHDGDPYTTALVSAFGQAFAARGGEIAATAGIDKGDEDMTEVLVAFAAAGPDGLFFPLFRAEGSHFAEQARASDGLADATFITGAAMLVSEFLATPQSENTYFAGPESDHGANVNAATGQNADEALAAYLATYGESPTSPYWAFAYDATTLLLHAIQSVAVAENGKLYIDRAALRATVGGTAGFQGLIGPLSCDDFGDCGTGRINIYHHTDSSVTDAAQLPVVYQFAP